MVWWACGCGEKAIVDPTASQEYALGCDDDGFYPEGPYGLAVKNTLDDYTLTAAVAGNLETVSNKIDDPQPKAATATNSS
jgi:hypothetical protein